MNLKRLFSFIVISGTILNVSQAVAQVKVGANPATIDPNNNLEVESANGNKTTVNKNTGVLTIKDGSQGSGKVLTSDANGVATWESNAATQVNFSVSFTGQTPFTANTNTKINFATANSNDGGGYDLTNDRFVAPVAGLYVFNGTVYVHGVVSASGGTYNDVLSIFVNGTPKLTQENFQYMNFTSGNAFGLSYMARLNVGDTVELWGRSTKGTPTFVGYASSINAPQTSFQGYLIGK